jgi:hypothetical protein
MPGAGDQAAGLLLGCPPLGSRPGHARGTGTSDQAEYNEVFHRLPALSSHFLTYAGIAHVCPHTLGAQCSHGDIIHGQGSGFTGSGAKGDKQSIWTQF